MAAADLAGRLGKGQPVLSAWMGGLPSSFAAEILAREPWDAVTLDLQHGLVDPACLRDCVTSIVLAGKPAAVRIALHDYATASRALDLGASAIIAPMINTVEDARAFAEACKFPPVGARSWGPTRATSLTGVADQAYLADANRATLAFAMIETVQALENFDAIADVPGIDGLFVGPSDLSVTLSGGASVDPAAAEVGDVMQDIARRAAARGKVVGAYAYRPERARLFAQWGYGFIAVGSDAAMLRAGSTAALAVARL